MGHSGRSLEDQKAERNMGFEAQAHNISEGKRALLGTGPGPFRLYSVKEYSYMDTFFLVLDLD